MTLGERYKQLKTDMDMAEALYNRWDVGEAIEYIERDYAQLSVHVLETLLETHPEIWEIINSLE